MNANISPAKIGGTINAIPSKSYIHRLLICASLSDSPTDIICSTTLSKDIEATIGCLNELGGKIEVKDNKITVTPIKVAKQYPFLNCYESGSTLRFLLPVVAALGVDASFLGTGKLPHRPINQLVDQLKKHEVIFFSETIPTTMRGKMTGGLFELSGDVSSQYVTGLLLALPIIGGGEIKILSPLQSKSYVDITIEVMKQFGVNVKESENSYIVSKDEKYSSAKSVTAQGDWSNASFWLCNGAINSETTVTGLDLKSSQGDRAIIDILKHYGANVSLGENSVTVSPNSRKAFDFNAEDIPDIVPIISVLASVADGVTNISNVERLRLKECDRIEATLQLINSLGGKAEYKDEILTIHGCPQLCGKKADGFNDHRIVMSAAIASAICKNDVTITDSSAVAKSYPTFFEDYKKLGGNFNVI